MFLVLVGLSVWQVQRLQWKEALIAERVSRTQASAADLPARADEQSEFRHVRVQGSFLHEGELYLAARDIGEGNPGYHILTPFHLSDGRGAIIVDRGFVPVERKLPSSRPKGQVTGTVTVDGYVRFPQRRAWFQPENEPGKNVWFTVDLAAMANKLTFADLRRDLYVEAGPQPNPGGWPRGGQTRIELPNDHLQYALTWALLALALAVIYVVYHLQLEGKKP
ncbi:MAG TPA: SURF1 family protein [Dongiaceae bacterium]|jgi:surfeit locus 1 family protein|nr:SURF1 family protein [Dongiaceae bacterium]